MEVGSNSKKTDSKQPQSNDNKNNTKSNVLFDDQKILNQKMNKMFGQWYEADCCDTN